MDRNRHNHRHQLNHFNQSSDCGFTLVELIVSMAIAGVLMVGLSTFFASTFHNLFLAQAENANTERQYAINQIVADKFGKMEYLVNPIAAPPADSDKILAFVRSEGGRLPFTYMASVDTNDDTINDRLAFKDLMPFNKIIKTGAVYAYGDSGEGKIKYASNEIVIANLEIAPTSNLINFAGFAIMDGNYYVAVPGMHEIQRCVPTGDTANCEALDLGFGDIELSLPMDVATDGTNLYISDAGNNRIIRKNPTFSEVIATNLNFPTGLAFYRENTDSYLFVADTFNGKVKKILLSSTDRPLPVTTVAGDGESDTCAGNARLCKLNLPTGLFVNILDDVPPGTHVRELYIADSGNNRILKISDPGKPSTIDFKFKLKDNYALGKIKLTNDKWSGGALNSTNLVGDGTNFVNKTFQNTDLLTVFSNNECRTSGNSIYVKTDPLSTALVLGPANKYLKTEGGTACKISSIDGPKPCGIAPDPSNPTAYKITIGSACGGTEDADGEPIYFSNPKYTEADPFETNLKIDSINWGTNYGFLTTKIEISDISDTVVETLYQTTAVGDGVLGTEEDGIQPVVFNDGSSLWIVSDLGVKTNFAGKNIEFPTGVSNEYFANTIGKNIVRRSDGTNLVNLNPVSTTFTNADYDYISDFPLDLLEPVKFNKYGKILEAVITTAPDSNDIRQVYKHDASLSK